MENLSLRRLREKYEPCTAEGMGQDGTQSKQSSVELRRRPSLTQSVSVDNLARAVGNPMSLGVEDGSGRRRAGTSSTLGNSSPSLPMTPLSALFGPTRTGQEDGSKGEWATTGPAKSGHTPPHFEEDLSASLGQGQVQAQGTPQSLGVGQGQGQGSSGVNLELEGDPDSDGDEGTDPFLLEIVAKFHDSVIRCWHNLFAFLLFLFFFTPQPPFTRFLLTHQWYSFLALSLSFISYDSSYCPLMQQMQHTTPWHNVTELKKISLTAWATFRHRGRRPRRCTGRKKTF